MKRPDLQALLVYWQASLRLLDWRIVMEYVRDLCAPDGEPVYGLCDYSVDSKSAYIQVRDPETPVDDGREPGAIVPETVIHELAHLHFAPFGLRTPAERAAEEQAVWAFAGALAAACGTPEEGQIARAMVAHVRRKSAAMTATRRNRKMDLMMLIAALQAASTAEDPKAAIDALIAQIKSGSGAGDAPPPAEGAPPSEAPPPAQRPARPAPAPQRPARPGPVFPGLFPGQPLAQRPLAQVASVSAEDVRTMVADGIDAARRDELLESEGAVLDEDNIRFARTQPFETVRRMVALAGGSAQPQRPSQSAPRRQSPTRAGAGSTGSAPRTPAADPSIAEADRRMGLAPATTQAIGRDPVTGRLMISNIAPNAVRRAGE